MAGRVPLCTPSELLGIGNPTPRLRGWAWAVEAHSEPRSSWFRAERLLAGVSPWRPRWSVRRKPRGGAGSMTASFHRAPTPIRRFARMAYIDISSLFPSMYTGHSSRRQFLLRSVSGLSSAWLALRWPAILTAQEHAQRAVQSGPAKFQFRGGRRS